MSNPIWGEDCSIEMWVGVGWEAFACFSNFSYACNVESIEFTGPNSGGVRQRRRRLEEHTVTVSGVTWIENDSTLSFFYVLQLGVRREEQRFRLTYVDGLGDQRTLVATGMIGPQSIGVNIGEFASCDYEIWLNEEPEFDPIEDPSDECEVVEKLFLTLAEGATSVSSATLSGKTILGVEREGLGQVIIGGTPAAGTREVSFSGTTISFDATNPGNVGGENIYVLYK
jgi:hypothetical protein